MALRVAILLHGRKSSPFHRRRYAIMHCVQRWRDLGHEVFILHGIRKFVPADICLVHVDLSVVPDEYLEFASRYPVAINGEVRDIRKSSFSENLLLRGADYRGQVIVKTDENYAGWPERLVNESLLSLVRSRLAKKINPGSNSILSSYDYSVFDSLEDVPESCWLDRTLVVEKFLPEKEGDIYYNNCYMFLGESDFCVRFGSTLPVVKAQYLVSQEVIAPHPDIVSRRHAMKFGYGKFDYAMHEGSPVLYDINTTFGVTRKKSRRKRSIEHFVNTHALEKLVLK